MKPNRSSQPECQRVGIRSIASLAIFPSHIRNVLCIVDEDIAEMAIDYMNGDLLRWSEQTWVNLHIARHLGRISRCLEKTQNGEQCTDESK